MYRVMFNGKDVALGADPVCVMLEILFFFDSHEEGDRIEVVVE